MGSTEVPDTECPPSQGATEAAILDGPLDELLARVRDVIDDRARSLLLLQAVGAMAADLSLDTVLSRIVSIAGTLVKAEHVALGVLSVGPDRRLRNFVHHGMGPVQVSELGALPVGRGLLTLIIDQPELLRPSDLIAHPSSHEMAAHHPPSVLFLEVPVRIRDTVLGNLYLTGKAGGVGFTQEDEDVVVALALAAGVAVENAQLFEKAGRREAWLTASAEITALISRSSAAEDTLQTVADRARQVSGADIAWIAAGEDRLSLKLRVVSGADASTGSLGSVSLEHSLASIVVQDGEPLGVEDLATDPRAVDLAAELGWPRLGPTLVVPLGFRSGVAGVLALAWSPDRLESFHALDVDLPVKFAEHAALALQVARGREDQQRLVVLEDRDRIARDLHDLVIQRLFGVGLSLQVATRLTDRSDVLSRVDEAVDDLDATIMDIRRSIFALGSPGIVNDIQSEVTRLVERSRSTLKFAPVLRFEGAVRTAVRGDVAGDVLAVLSEALSNVSRHAGASAVQVRLRTGTAIVLTVEDDGRGLPGNRSESGLRNMRERAEVRGGTLLLGPSASGGTWLEWSVPTAMP